MGGLTRKFQQYNPIVRFDSHVGQRVNGACPPSSAAATLLGGRREVGNQVVVTRDQQAEQDSDDQGAPNEGFPPAH